MTLTIQEKQYYEESLSTLKSKGWRLLTEDWQKQCDSYANISAIATAEQLWFAKGRVDQLDYFLGMPDMFERAYDEMMKEDDE